MYMCARGIVAQQKSYEFSNLVKLGSGIKISKSPKVGRFLIFSCKTSGFEIVFKGGSRQMGGEAATSPTGGASAQPELVVCVVVEG